MENKREYCSSHVENEEAMAKARSAMPPGDVLARLSRTFSAFSDLTRLRIMLAVSSRELCVCELSKVLGMSSPAVSHHLRRLKDLGLVRTRREGKMVYYLLDDEHVQQILATGLEHIKHKMQRG